ncbi:MAG TPA: ABC transporter ATP-binding protein [Alphaproteobacteria bacterium]|jgi:iron(III) transport system ATP-binding protein|nr:ABC transporter ATP-binding protein [Alphaproteobacteria bacterium]
MAAIEVIQLEKTYTGATKAVAGVDFEVEPGTVFTLLGPSGCGKTTTLRCVAGLENPDHGDIRLGGEVVFSSADGIRLPPSKRKIGMVFQSYAIWPHMTVFQNVAYPLRGRGLRRTEIRERAMEALRMVNLDGFAERSAPKLSGGQQQRVALARAIAGEPRLFLLDEPLSNLDAKLREEMRSQILDLQRKLGVTTLYVTHDQVEALSMSHRIAVMEQGRIVEVAAPRDVYLHPRSRFAAQFVGLTNIVPARVTGGSEGKCAVDAPFARIVCQDGGKRHAEGERAMVLIRPENIAVSTTTPAETINVWRGQVVSTVFLGEFLECVVACGDTQMRARISPFIAIDVGDEVFLQAAPERLSIIAE